MKHVKRAERTTGRSGFRVVVLHRTNRGPWTLTREIFESETLATTRQTITQERGEQPKEDLVACWIYVLPCVSLLVLLQFESTSFLSASYVQYSLGSSTHYKKNNARFNKWRKQHPLFNMPGRNWCKQSHDSYHTMWSHTPLFMRSSPCQ